ncbi:TPA: hypothetical protein ACJKCC_001810, partial [Neisseria meningitidis]
RKDSIFPDNRPQSQIPSFSQKQNQNPKSHHPHLCEYKNFKNYSGLTKTSTALPRLSSKRMIL